MTSLTVFLQRARDTLLVAAILPNIAFRCLFWLSVTLVVVAAAVCFRRRWVITKRLTTCAMLVGAVVVGAVGFRLFLLYRFPGVFIFDGIENYPEALTGFRHVWTRPWARHGLTALGAMACAAFLWSVAANSGRLRWGKGVVLAAAGLMTSLAGHVWLTVTNVQIRSAPDLHSASGLNLVQGFWVPDSLPEDTKNIRVIFQVDVNLVCGIFESSRDWLIPAITPAPKRTYSPVCARLPGWSRLMTSQDLSTTYSIMDGGRELIALNGGGLRGFYFPPWYDALHIHDK